MRILADENLNQLFVNDLRGAGHIVLSIRENFNGISDLEVATLAEQGNSLLITEDKDFGELIFAHKISKITIVFLRYQKADIDLVRQQLLEIIQIYKDKEGHFFITIAKGRVRITEL